MNFFKNLISAPRGCAIMFAILIALIALPALTQAQTSSYTPRVPKLTSGTAHTSQYTYKPGLFINQRISLVFPDTSTAADDYDTLIIPGYRNGMRILHSPITWPTASIARKPIMFLHMRELTDTSTKKDTLIVRVPLGADTTTRHLEIIDR